MKKRYTVLLMSSVMASALFGCGSFGQKADETWSRKPGERLLGSPEPVAAAARQHWQYAWLSEAAYQESRKAEPGAPPPCPIPDRILEMHGWSRWNDFPNGQLAADLNQEHLRVDVWYHPAENILAVAFGGTVFTSRLDWRANLRWFIPGDDGDEYSVLVRHFIPAFQAEFHARRGRPGYERLGSVRLISTGHSLGGGLAQQFAYALVPDKELPRVSTVYAFDSSPVTGFYSVDKAIREANSQQLHVERIYERGEGLAAVRSILAAIYPPSASAPTINETRYALFWKPSVFALRSAVDQHSMMPFASEMTRAVSPGNVLVNPNQLQSVCPAQATPTAGS
jgi:hypothetical protein